MADPWDEDCLGHTPLFRGHTPDDAVNTSDVPFITPVENDTVTPDPHPKLIPPIVPPAIAGGSAAAAAEETCPFDLSISGTGASSFINVEPGSINSLVPAGIFTPYAYDATSSTPIYVIVRSSTNGRAVTSSTMVFTTTPALVIETTANAAPATFDVLIGVVVGAVATKTWGCGNIQAITSQTSSEDSTTPIAGVSNLIRWFTWVLSLI